jgi:hypothetical protein
VWWYHHAVLEQDGPAVRSEGRRVYEYLLAGAGLLTAAAGLATLAIAALEGATNSTVLTGPSPVNTVLAAVTLLVVGTPVWVFYWRLTQAAARTDPSTEVEAPTRRAYLFALLGAGSVAAVVSLLVAVYQFFAAAFDDPLGAATVRSARFAIGILLAAAAVTVYHWSVYRADRAVAPARRRGPRYVLVVGPHEPDLARVLARSTGGRVQAWAPAANGGAGAAPAEGGPVVAPSLTADAVLEALGDISGDEVVVLCEAGQLRAIPVHRE